MIFIKKPWGFFLKLIHLKSFWFKFLFVSGRTSLQSHKERDEYFLGVFYVPAGEKHRLQHGLFLEIATGNPQEGDIVRYEDDYSRD